ncbi:MAG: hypothetical protein JO025_00505 [Verrucomicrobia bacterium]|nr:hypothetical protein [Verrucomicrobiota bacterium]
MGRINSKRCAFADGLSFAFGDRCAIGLCHTNAIGFTTSVRFTGSVPFRDSFSDPFANGVAETGRIAGTIPFPVRGLVKPGFSLDDRCFANTNTRGAAPAKKTTAAARARESKPRGSTSAPGTAATTASAGSVRHQT